MIGDGVVSIDFETRSTLKLPQVGVYRYAVEPTTDIWCMAYAFGDGDVRLWTPGMDPPLELLRYKGPHRAHNAQFERVIWREILGPRYGFPVPDDSQWFCTAAEVAAMGLPRALGQAAKVLGLEEQKDGGGRKLMLQMARPRKTHEDGTVEWWDVEEKRERLYEYCRQDVRTERAVAKHVRRLTPYERKVYLLDQRINDRGFRLDIPLVRAARRLADRAIERREQELRELTDGEVDAVTKVKDLTEWLQKQGVDVDNVQKATLRDLMDEPELLALEVREVIQIRQDAGRTSTGKLDAMLRVADPEDHRARGLLLYHGAGPGRWTGKLIQPHNFPRGEVKNVRQYIPHVMEGDLEMLALERLPAPVVISSMLRAMMVASEGHRLMAADFSQIEARVLGWVAGEPYGEGEYERMAAAIYGVPVGEIENPSERRTVGKNTVLGAGYQMGPDTYREQIHKQAGVRVSEELSRKAIDTYRERKPGIRQFWYDIEDAALEAVANEGKVVEVGVGGPVRYVVRDQFLWCVLPSGRPLAYALPRIDKKRTPWGTWKAAVTFMTVDGYTRKWTRKTGYGGLFTENVVQAMARDLMTAAMVRVEEAGYPVVLTVHDEVVSDVPDEHGSLEEFLKLMHVRPRWARDIPVKAEGWEGDRYRK